MRRLRDLTLDILQTCLRMLPWPTEPRLIQVGNPGRKAPVLVTGNYSLTVRRVLRALAGQNVYLLVVNTRGHNVWCASAGGHLTAHKVIAGVRTSGINQLVDHRRLIVPQLCATGVDREMVKQRTGWRIVFGPVYARDLPAYLGRGRKTAAMREVRFPLGSRLEMGAAWAFPISVLGGLILLVGWPGIVPVYVLMVWSVALILYGFFPWLSRQVVSSGKHMPGWTRYLVFFDPVVRRNIVIWLVFVAALSAYAYGAGGWGVGDVAGWSLALLFIMLLFSMDLAGSTPLFKSRLHEDYLLQIELNDDACRGRALCREVCPRNCYDIDSARHRATMVYPGACVQCGACIVQCPEDALAFVTPAGELIPPEMIRGSKVQLSGRRSVPLT